MGKALAAVLGCALLLPLVVATAAGGMVAALLRVGAISGRDGDGCAVAGPSSSAVGYAPDQLGNAATIIAVGKQQHLPPRGWVIAVAVAMQESGLHNLDHGDRDSLGLFQQRPSTGWGSPGQIQNPVYSATQFYRHLQAVSGWQAMPLTVAAQAVQGSGTPQAYAHHEPHATQLVARVGAASCSPTSAAS